MTPTRSGEAGPIVIRAEPIDARRCRFVVDRPVYSDRWAYFASRAEASESPMAQRLFELERVTSVVIAHDKITITRPMPEGLPIIGKAVRLVRALLGDRTAGAESWPGLGREIAGAIRDHLASGQPAVNDSYSVLNRVDLRPRVQKVIDAEINPVIAGHGGGVTIVDVRDNVVYLQMWGGCQGCGLADLTLKHGVEAVLRDAVPEIGEIIDLTDHAAGVHPYHKK